jgi:hypothetical protein
MSAFLPVRRAGYELTEGLSWSGLDTSIPRRPNAVL